MSELHSPAQQPIEHEPLADALARVEALLGESQQPLQSPLRELVEGQVASARPHLRAAVVLAASTPPARAPADERPFYLAAALEMLFVALSTHKRLLDIETPERTLLGGTILVGDYCFGQAAALVVRSEHPKVVTIFSEALKLVSEGALRQSMRQSMQAARQPAAGPNEQGPGEHGLGERGLGELSLGEHGLGEDAFDENGVLFDAGIRAAGVLADHTPATQSALLDVGRALAARLRNPAIDGALDLSRIPARQRPRWQAVAALADSAAA